MFEVVLCIYRPLRYLFVLELRCGLRINLHQIILHQLKSYYINLYDVKLLQISLQEPRARQINLH